MKLKYIFILIIIASLNASCKRDDDTKIGVSIFDAIKQEQDLSTLAQAIDKANIKGALTGTQYTFLAPSNQAFTDAGINVSTLSEDELLKILNYHIIPSRVDSSQFDLEYAQFNKTLAPSGTLSSNWLGMLTYRGYQTLNLDVNSNVYLTQSIEVRDNTNADLVGRGVFFNGASVTKSDAFEGADGLVHKINRVLLPPAGNLAEVIAATSELSLFNLLVTKASTSATGSPSFAATTLSGLPADAINNSRAGTFTVLAPTNNAMKAEGWDEASINALTTAQALDIAKQHVIDLRYFSSDLYNQLFRNNPAVTTVTLATQLAGFNVNYNNTGGSPFFSSTGTANAGIVNSDIVTTNGVLYTINAVLK